MRAMKRLVSIAACALALALLAGAAKKDSDKAGAAKGGGGGASEDKAFDEVVKDMEVIPGLFTIYRKADDNKLLMEIRPEQLEHLFLFAMSFDQSTGERGFYGAMMGGDFPFLFHRVGKTVQWVMKNTAFTASSGTP